MGDARTRVIIEAVDKFTETMDKLGNVTKSTLESTTTVTKSVTEATDKASGGFKIMGMNVVDVAAKLYILQVALRNVAQAAEEAFVLARLGASIKDQAGDFQRMLDQLGVAPGLMEKMHVAAGGLTTDFDLQQSTVKLLVDKHGEYGKKLAEGIPLLIEEARALRANNASLGSLDEVTASLVKGIDTLMPRTLKQTGIVIDQTKAYNDYADKINVAHGALTIEEKQLALLNAVLAEHDTVLKQAGGTTADVTDKYDQFKTHLSNAKNALGELLDQALAPSIIVLNNEATAVEALGVEFDRLTGHTPELKAMEDVLSHGLFSTAISPATVFTSIIETLTGWMKEYNDSIEKATGKSTQFGKAVEEAFSNVPHLVDDAISSVTDYADKWDSAAEKIARAQVDANQKIFDATLKTQNDITQIADDLANKLNDINNKSLQDRLNAQADYTNRVGDLAYNLGQDMMRIAHQTYESGKSMDESFSDNKESLEHRRATTIRDSTERLQDLDWQYQHATSDSQRESINRQRTVAKRELQDKLDDINWELNAQREKYDRAKVDLSERNSWEVNQEQEKINHEQAMLARQLSDKLSSITVAENAATQKANEEADKRQQKSLEALQKTKDDIEKNFRLTWLDSMQSVVDKGSTVHNMLEIARLKTMGASDAALRWRDDLILVGQTAQGLSMILGAAGLIPLNQINVGWIDPHIGHPGRAGGGDVMGGHPYMVGESGPELFMPRSGGTIVPSGGGGGGTVNVTIQAGAFMGSQADAQKLGQQLIPIISRALQSYNINIFATGNRRTASVR